MNSVTSLMILALLGAMPSAAHAECILQGTVIDAESGQPLPKTQVFVAAYPEEDSGIPIRRIAGASGEFCFEHLEAGRYIVTARRSGYLAAHYGAQRPHSPGLVMEIAAQKPSPNVAIKMTPQATISGTAVDADGDPIRNAGVELLERAWTDGKMAADAAAQMQADEEGKFRFAGLSAGTYYISAQREEEDDPSRHPLDNNGQPFRERDAKTYYDGSLSFREARPIGLKTGQEITGVIVVLQKTALRHVSGRIGAGWNGNEPPMLWIANDSIIQIQKDGTFRADGLLPGQYVLQGRGESNLIASTPIDLTEHDADGVVVEPVELISLEMVIRTEGGSAGTKRSGLDRVFLVDSKSGHEGLLEADGKFRFAEMEPSTYEIQLGENGDDYFVKRVLVDGEPQSGTSIDLRTAHPKLVEVLLSSNRAALSGRVSTYHAITNGIAVVLMNETGVQRWPEQTSTDTNGQFEWKSLAPGKYRLYAFEDFDENSWGSPDLAAMLAAKSVALELHEGEKRQVTVPLISAAEYQQALRKAGF